MDNDNVLCDYCGKSAINTCPLCGTYLCDECSADENYRCKNCRPTLISIVENN